MLSVSAGGRLLTKFTPQVDQKRQVFRSEVQGRTLTMIVENSDSILNSKEAIIV